MFWVYYMYVSGMFPVIGMLPFLWGAFRSSKRHRWLSCPQMRFLRRRSKSTARSCPDINSSWYMVFSLYFTNYIDHKHCQWKDEMARERTDPTLIYQGRENEVVNTYTHGCLWGVSLRQCSPKCVPCSGHKDPWEIFYLK